MNTVYTNHAVGAFDVMTSQVLTSINSMQVVIYILAKNMTTSSTSNIIMSQLCYYI